MATEVNPTSGIPGIVSRALAEPVEPVTVGWMARIGVLLAGMWVAFYAPINVLLALQAAAIDPAHKQFVFALTSGVGAILSVLANPLVGTFSDRTDSRWGRRVPWVAGGAVLAAGSLALLSTASTVVVMIVGWCLVQLGVSTMQSAVTAVVPDQVPHRQRGTVGGVVGVSTTVGILAGSAIGAAAGGVASGYLAAAGILVLASLPFLLRSRDVRLPRQDRPPLRPMALLRGFWVSPRRHPDFAWAWLTRFLINLGNVCGTLYLLYYLQDAVHYPDPKGGVFVLVLLYSITVVATTLVGGRLSDRRGRRKIFVTVSGAIMAVALVTLTLQSWPWAIVAALLLGAAYGVYLSVDFALMTELLPVAANRAKDLGVIAIAQNLPSVLAPLIASLIVTTLGGYRTLFLVAGGIALLGALLVTQIRGVA